MPYWLQLVLGLSTAYILMAALTTFLLGLFHLDIDARAGEEWNHRARSQVSFLWPIVMVAFTVIGIVNLYIWLGKYAYELREQKRIDD